MEFNWDEVEELIKPSPSYQSHVKRLLEILSYEFVRETCSHSMKEAGEYAARLLGCDPRGRYGDYLERLQTVFRKLDNLGVKDYRDFINRIETREKFESFYGAAGLSIRQIIVTLRYLLNWVLPSKYYLRELIDKDDPKALGHVTALRENGIRFTLDILEQGRTPAGRAEISQRSGVPEDFVYQMVNRADFTRMPYVRGSTVRNYFHAGYDTLEKLSKADLDTLTEDVTRYGRTIGKNLKHGMELDSGIAISKVLPKLVEH